ncbi:M14 family metallopeptidase [candidate division KSB1 bacterium]
MYKYAGSFVLLIITALISLNFASLSKSAAEDEQILQCLSAVFDKGYILQDRNEDNVIDFVEVKIVIPEESSESELISAANISARLGFETSGVNMDMTGYDNEDTDGYDTPVIIIGKRNKAVSDLIETNLTQLTPGQGEIYLLRPDPFFRKGGVWIRGRDETGLLEAVDYFSGRYPEIWSMNGKKYADLNKQITSYLEENEIICEDHYLRAISVDASSPGVFKASYSIITETTDDGDKIIEILKKEDEKENEKDSKKLKTEDLVLKDIHKLEIVIHTPDKELRQIILPEKPWNTKASSSNSPKDYPDFSLSDIFSIKGIFKDTNKDLVPDEMNAVIYVSGVTGTDAVTDLGARIGLETAGIRLPLFMPAGEDDHPEKGGFPIVYGVDSYQLRKQKEEGRLYGLTGNKGEGFIQFLPGAFNEKNGIIIGGTDSEGLDAVTDYVSMRFPYLWDHGKGNFRLKDIERQVDEFFKAKSVPGQITAALYKIDEWLDRLGGSELESIEFELAATETPSGLSAYITDAVKNKFPGIDPDVKLYKTGFGEGKEIFEEEFSIPWEVDEFWRIFREDALPQINAGSSGRIIACVSESPEIRQNIKTQIIGDIRRKGADVEDFEIDVLCAYKQGYSWLYDSVLPKIRGRDIGRIEIVFHSLKDTDEIKWQTIHSNTRWLQEIYPIDAVFSRELGIPDSLISFKSSSDPDPIYRVSVFNKDDEEIFNGAFDPTYDVRPFFDLFPEYESVRVTTGWCKVEINGSTVVDKRIKTDPETFWDHLQNTTFRKMIDYTMDIQNGRPSADNAPYFDEFRVELTLSEPDYRIGIDEEAISSLEALHEDIYFETLSLYDRIAGRYGVRSMNYPGRILPFIQPAADGKPGKAKITLTGKERGTPELVMKVKEKGRELQIKKYDLRKLSVDTPKLRGIKINSGSEGPAQLLFEVKATDPEDRYEEFRQRTSEASIDAAVISAVKLSGMVDILGRLHNKGILEESLSYDRVDEMLFRFVLEDSTEFSKLTSLKQSGDPQDTGNPELDDRDFRYAGDRIVLWEEPFNNTDANELMAKLNTFPNINTYFVSKSYLGNDIYAMDLLPVYESEFISQAKLNAQKPTVFISGRQHANEVSSTSHILRLAELIATDDEYAGFLKNVNVVLHPVLNADGANLAVEIHKTNPDFMVHSAYLGPLGVDIDGDSRSADPRYPESKVRGELREAWLPDVYINMHGYPSHEWVQYFAGYSAWVRTRTGGQRSWWAPRGWFIPGFRWIDDDKHPEHKTAAFALLDSVAVSITSNEQVNEINNRMYRRYKKYREHDTESFGEYFHNGILVNMSLKGRKMSGSGVTSPNVTYFSITTEAPDEIASGDWMKLMGSMGLSHSTAVLKYLNNGKNEIKRESKEYADCVTRKVYRVKPVVPKTKNEDNKKEGTR